MITAVLRCSVIAAGGGLLETSTRLDDRGSLRDTLAPIAGRSRAHPVVHTVPVPDRSRHAAFLDAPRAAGRMAF
jgi:hypothetical protein